MTDKQKKAINKDINQKIFNGDNINNKTYFKRGMLKRHLLVEAGSKFSNKLNVISGQEKVDGYTNLQETINLLKYKLPEYGEVALIENNKRKNEVYIGKVMKSEDFGTGELQYLRVQAKELKHGGKTYTIEEEYMLDPRTKDLSSYVVKTTVLNNSDNQQISVQALNELLGRKFYNLWVVLDTPYIPAVIFRNSFDGESDIEGLEEVFLLERQLLREITRDLNLGRKKILYKTRLARKSKSDLEVEMNNDSIVVFEDGNAVFTSPIDLWAPQLVIETITRTIDWLVNYTLKMKFAAKDSMATGAQKTDEQVSELNQSAQNYLEDKKEMWSHYMTKFLNLSSGESEVEVEFQLMTTVDRLVNGVETGLEGPKPLTPAVEVE